MSSASFRGVCGDLRTDVLAYWQVRLPVSGYCQYYYYWQYVLAQYPTLIISQEY